MISSLSSNEFAANVTNSIASYLHGEAVTPAWTWATTIPLLVVVTFVFDFGSKYFRDRKLRHFGSPAQIIPFKAPLGQISKHHMDSPIANV